jgi:hypothetical protein
MTTIDINSITTGSVTGTGIFDKLMASVEDHIDYQFKKQRIKSSDYATVYLGALTAVLGQSVQYELGRHQAAAQADLTLKQIEVETARVAKLNKDKDLVTQQISNLTAEKLRLEADTLNIPKQGSLLDKQILKTVQDTALVVLQGALSDSQNTKTQKESLLVAAQAAKIAKDDALVTQQKLNLEEEKLNLAAQRSLLNIQVTKTGLEGNLLTAKKNSEVKQLDIMTAQVALYTAQKDGFARDAEQKLARLMVQAHTVKLSTDTNNTIPSKLDDGSINAVIGQAKVGIGLLAGATSS